MGAWMYLGIVFIIPLSLGVFAIVTDLPISTDEALQGAGHACRRLCAARQGRSAFSLTSLSSAQAAQAVQSQRPFQLPVASTALNVLVAWLR